MLSYHLTVSGKRAFSGVNVVYGNESIYFRGTNKTNGGNSDEDLFYYLNTLFDSLPPEVVEKHWQYLKAAKRVIEPGYFDEDETEEIVDLRKNNLDYKYLISKIHPILKDIYINIKPETITYGAEISGYITPPSDLNAVTIQSDYPEETTINEYKYKELAKIAFVIQLIYPIINQLLDHVTLITGKEYRDAVVGELISHLDVIIEHPGYFVLDTYLRVSCLRQEAKRNTTSVISEIKYIDHVVYKGLFTKLALTYLPSKIKGKNLSKELNSLVTNEVRSDNDVKFKSYGDVNPIGEDLSIQESYNISQEINASDELAQCEYFTFDLIVEDSPGVFSKKTNGFFKYQCAGLGIKNREMAEKIYNSLPTNSQYHLEELHIKLLQLTFQNDVNYNLYQALDYDQLMAASALAQTKLFELGFEHLAACIFAVKNKNIIKTLPDDSYRLTANERAMLVNICGDYIGQQTGTTDNTAVIAVNELLDELISCGWESNIEPGLLGNKKYLELMSPNHRYPIEVTSKIKEELLALIMLHNGITDNFKEDE